MTSNTPDLMTIWYYDGYISIDIKRQMKIHLHQTFNYSRTFDCLQEFTNYLATPIVQRIICIVTSKNAKQIEWLARRRRQCRFVYQLPFVNQKSSKPSNPESVHSTIETSFKTIVDDLRQENVLPESVEGKALDEETDMDDKTLPFGIFKSISVEHSFSYLNKESLKFLLCQSLIELFIKMPYDASAFKHMCFLFRDYYKGNLSEIDEFEDNYHPTKAIYYYTRPCFLFRAINQVLRLYDVNRMYEFGCYMADLYKNLEELGNEQRCTSNQTMKTVFRGKILSNDILQQLKDNIGQPLSMNGLLSTTEDSQVASDFAGIRGIQNEYQSAVFEMHIDNTANLIRPYANVSKQSAIKDEKEVLFFMGFVWKIKSMEEMAPKRWYIVLESCKDYDSDLIKYIENLKGKCPFLTVGNILQELGDFANAKNFYQLITEDETFSEETRGHAECAIAMLAADRGEYMDELKHLREAEKLIKQTATPDSKTLNPPRPLFSHDINPSRIRILNNMGRAYRKIGKPDTARNYFEKALKEPGVDIERAAILNNYGLLESQCRDYNKAYDYFNEAVQLATNDARVTDFKDNLELVKNILLKNNNEAINTRNDTN